MVRARRTLSPFDVSALSPAPQSREESLRNLALWGEQDYANAALSDIHRTAAAP